MWHKQQVWDPDDCRRADTAARHGTSHTASRSVYFLEKENADFIEPDLWPPNSPYINPVDYAIRGTLQQHVFTTENSVRSKGLNERQLLNGRNFHNVSVTGVVVWKLCFQLIADTLDILCEQLT